MTKEGYLKLTGPFRRHPGLARILHNLNRGLTALMFAAYVLLLAYQLLTKDLRLARCIIVPLDAFLVTSVLRWLVARKRPYETFGEAPVIRKESRGDSFPSRHVFSAFVIAMTFLLATPWTWAGLLLLAASAAIAAIRVLSGVHYISDVICGALIGIGAGLLGYLVF